jgi:hypothetical protein
MRRSPPDQTPQDSNGGVRRDDDLQPGRLRLYFEEYREALMRTLMSNRSFQAPLPPAPEERTKPL